MRTSTGADPRDKTPELPAGGANSADDRRTAVPAATVDLDGAARADRVAPAQRRDAYQSQLVRTRLGLASSLFAAIRAKHAPTATHCLRVALGISSWSLALDFSDAQRDLMEIGALLHDIGKIGVPDSILLKPAKLAGDERLIMDRRRDIGREILSGCCASPELLDIVFYATAWYDGSRHGVDRRGDKLPLASRMIAIVDAFDSMTTDHVFRRAMSLERAMAELIEYSGSQFDAKLAEIFCRLIVHHQLDFQDQVVRRWLHQLQPERANQLWTLEPAVPVWATRGVLPAFHEKLLEAMHDGVVFLDEQLVILSWNRAAERLTGIAASSVIGVRWLPSLVELCDERGKPIPDGECPVVESMHSGVQLFRRLSVAGRFQRRLSLDVHVAPIWHENGQVRGAALMFRDASSQISLQERVQTLHEKATRDPLTKIANRAEFDRVFPEFIATHHEQGLPCSLIICDIDHFKRINDTHGHQAGDVALISFASLLKRFARQGDLVARYGGEEFVVLCADCDNATATRRAEEMRRGIAEIPQPSLHDERMTASFGVTEIQAGDTPETFLRRADRALLQAKQNKRNVVVQLGTGIADQPPQPPARGWFAWLGKTPAATLVERTLVTPAPLSVTAEKLRGYMADHHAELVSLVEKRLVVKIDGQHLPMQRRSADRPVVFLIEMTFHEERTTDEQKPGRESVRTLVQVVIRPKRHRDRRKRDAVHRAQQLLASLKSYLMAQDCAAADLPDITARPSLGRAEDDLSALLTK